MNERKRQKYLPLTYAALTALFVAAMGGIMTDVGPWYQSLQKPSWQPPDWLFAPAWTLMYATIVLSFITAWTAIEDKRLKNWLTTLFFLNAALNVLWSIIFFHLQRPDWALYENILLWLSVASLVLVTWKLSRTASMILLPYLAWVSFATILNYTVVELNGPF